MRHRDRVCRVWAYVLAVLVAGSVAFAAQHDRVGMRIVEAAREQLSWGTRYDPSYVRLQYPKGDVPKDRGVCTDVVIRALRAVGHDLQRLIHEDAKRAPGAYPRIERRDPNIDHRRCPNQMAFLARHGARLGTSLSGAARRTWQPGDIVFWKLDNGLDHVGIVTDRIGQSGLPMAVHNLSTPAEEDVLGRWTITGHFRYPKR